VVKCSWAKVADDFSSKSQFFAWIGRPLGAARVFYNFSSF